MARITLADEFASLYGRVGDVVLIRRWKRHYMRPYVKPANPVTEARIAGYFTPMSERFCKKN